MSEAWTALCVALAATLVAAAVWWLANGDDANDLAHDPGEPAQLRLAAE